MTPDDKKWFRSYLAEGIHTAFRKGSDHPEADAIWKAIRGLPPAEWSGIVGFVADAMIDGIEYREKQAASAPRDLGANAIKAERDEHKTRAEKAEASERKVLEDHSAALRRYENAGRERDAEIERLKNENAVLKANLGKERNARLLDAQTSIFSSAFVKIFAEHERQKSVEGYAPEHDDEHGDGSMAAAAAAYSMHAFLSTSYRAFAIDPIGLWPWSAQTWKPKDPRSDLVRAGALIVTEIERLDRADPCKPVEDYVSEKVELLAVISRITKERNAAILALNGLVAKAEHQVKYWRDERQPKEKFPQDAENEEGEIDPDYTVYQALHAGFCNGRYSEADWWQKTISVAMAPIVSEPETAK